MVPGVLDDFLASAFGSFAVVSVPRSVTPGMVRALAEHGVPALAETPPASDLDGRFAIRARSEAFAQGFVQAGSRRQGHALSIIDNLRVDL